MAESELAKTLRKLIKTTDQLIRDVKKDGRALTKVLTELQDLKDKGGKEDKEGDGKG